MEIKCDMFYVYVIQSQKDNKLYTGFTSDLRKRFKQHNSNEVASTKGRSPFRLIYYEACVNEQDARPVGDFPYPTVPSKQQVSNGARIREKYLKSGWGKRYLKNRLKRFLFPTG